MYGQGINSTYIFRTLKLCFIESPLINNVNNTTFGDDNEIKQCLPTPAKLERNAVDVNVSQ